MEIRHVETFFVFAIKTQRLGDQRAMNEWPGV